MPLQKRYTIYQKEVKPVKKYDISRLMHTFGAPVLLTVLGGIMVLNPDSAAVVIARLLGWILVVVCGIRLIPMVTGSDGIGNPFLNVTCLALGIWLLCNPLALASVLGRFLGVLLLIRGGRNLYAGRNRIGLPVTDLICAVVGALLILMPLSASRLAFTLVGLVLVILGVTEIIIRAKTRKYLTEGDDPNIIDAL